MKLYVMTDKLLAIEMMLKRAKQCHSKLAWEKFFSDYGSEIATLNSSKPLHDIYRSFVGDEHCLQYDVNIWLALLKGCINAWDLELGTAVAEMALEIPNPAVRLKAAEIYLESGRPSDARKIATQTSRLKKINSVEAITAQMIICKSYVEEGRNNMAKKMLSKLESSVEENELPPMVKADMLSNIARSKFFLGNYLKAAAIFERAYYIFSDLGDWEAAVSSLFNAAANYDNAGMANQEKALRLVTRCESIAEQHNLRGPLSHCHAFRGTHFHHRGFFSIAADYYRKALRLIPETETSFRKLHILSMLTLTFIKSGKFKYAEKYGNRTLDLAKKDGSERFKIRYVTLEAELYWQKGEVSKAYKLLEEVIKPLYSNGVHTLEELATLSRFNIKSAQLNIETQLNVKIAKILETGNATWVEYLISLCCQHMIRHNYAETESLAHKAMHASQIFKFKYFEAQAHTLLAQSKAVQRNFDQSFADSLLVLKQVAENPEFKLFSIQYYLIAATQAYAMGYFEKTTKLLKEAHKAINSPFQKQEILSTWLSTMEGHSPKMSYSWQKKFIISSTKMYFSPEVQYLGQSKYLVSHHYEVSLGHFPILDRLLRYLMDHKNQSVPVEEIQTQVWQQSIQQQGWQQKIRNAIMRIRSLFPYTIAPIIVYNDGKLHLFREAIRFVANQQSPQSETQILEMLQTGPQSRVQLSNRIDISQSTTKRLLQKMVKDKQIKTTKVGRRVLYQRFDDTNEVVH